MSIVSPSAPFEGDRVDGGSLGLGTVRVVGAYGIIIRWDSGLESRAENTEVESHPVVDGGWLVPSTLSVK